MLSGIAYAQGQLDRANALAEEALVQIVVHSDRVWQGMTHWYLGLFAAARGDLLEAARHHRTCFVDLTESEDSDYPFKPLIGLAAIAAACALPEAAARLLGAADRLRRHSGVQLFLFDRPAHEAATAAAREALGERRFSALQQEGRGLAPGRLLEEANLVVAAAASARRPGQSFSLNTREMEVLRLIAAGQTDREIADVLCLSRRTVNSHVANILGRLGVPSRQDAVTRARAVGLLPDAPNATRYT